MEVFSKMMMRAENLGRLHGTKISRAAPLISHLLFVDDIIIFARATIEEARTVVDIMTTYSGWSG